MQYNDGNSMFICVFLRTSTIYQKLPSSSYECNSEVQYAEYLSPSMQV
jgi:hypothetical protein